MILTITQIGTSENIETGNSYLEYTAKGKAAGKQIEITVFDFDPLETLKLGDTLALSLTVDKVVVGFDTVELVPNTVI